MRQYPVGIQDFKEIRDADALYIDKTEYIWRMSSSVSKYYFLSRPRRFGKSLLVSTMQYYFEGRKELFEGLYIGEKEKDWEYLFALDSIFVPSMYSTSPQKARRRRD